MRQSAFRPWWLTATMLSLLGVLTLTHIPGPDVPKVLQAGGLDKFEHVAAYGLIASCFLLSLKRPARPALLLGLVVLAGIGALDETTQPFVQRTASLADYACDLTGIAVACLLFAVAKLSGLRVAPR